MKVLAAGVAIATTLLVTMVSVSSGRSAASARWVIDANRTPPSDAVRRAVHTPPDVRIASADGGAATHASADVGARGISIDALDAVINRYCGQCHNPTMKRGNLVLRDYSLDTITANLALSEKMIRKLRADMMPPPGSRRPEGDTLLALVETMEQLIDAAGPIESGRARLPAPQPPRVRARRRRPARRARRRRRLSCRSTPRAPTSTTSPTRRRSRPRCSTRTSTPPPR